MGKKTDTGRGRPPPAKALKLADLVQYQSGTIVSRTLVQRPTGTVTLFAFAAGEGLSEHTAPFDALVEILDGAAEITVSGRKLRARAGELVLLPARKTHALQAVERFKMLLVMIRS